jgi:hypothetical protein
MVFIGFVIMYSGAYKEKLKCSVGVSKSGLEVCVDTCIHAMRGGRCMAKIKKVWDAWVEFVW